MSARGYEAREAGRNSTQLVTDLFQKYGFYHDVIDHLSGDSRSDESVRRLTLQIANSRKWEDADKLRKEAWATVSLPNKDIAAYKEALAKAEKANGWEPNDPAILGTLGAVQYRMGAYEAALKTLTMAAKVRAYKRDESNPAALAFTAMALRQLGQADKATSTLEQLRALLKDVHFSDDEEAKALFAEAEDLIEGKKP